MSNLSTLDRPKKQKTKTVTDNTIVLVLVITSIIFPSKQYFLDIGREMWSSARRSAVAYWSCGVEGEVMAPLHRRSPSFPAAVPFPRL
ncbi:hypothetical protein J6590_093961 [Homalodisca vitripennis]|nr:hypothetical protein J6590_093961 [Homalodisca vitripennis]